MRRAARLLAGLLVLAPVPALVSAGEDALDVTGAWARPSGGAPVSAVYLTIANAGDAPERLVAVRTPAARSAQLHETVHDGEVMRMRHRPEGFSIAPGGERVLAPGGAHVMLMGLAAPLVAGDALELTLVFEPSGERVVTVPVRSEAP